MLEASWSISFPLLDVQQRVTEPDLKCLRRPLDHFEPPLISALACHCIRLYICFLMLLICYYWYCKFHAPCSMISARPQYLWRDGLGFGPGTSAFRASQGPSSQGACRGPCRGATGGVDAASRHRKIDVLYVLVWCVVLMLSWEFVRLRYIYIYIWFIIYVCV